MLEVLIAYVCINGIGCQDTIKAYHEYNPEVKTSVDNAQRVVKKAAGPTITKYLFPLFVTMYSNQGLVIPLNNGFYLETDKFTANNRIGWTHEF